MAKGIKTGGRAAGTPNKATAEIKDAAREYGPAAVRRLAELAGLVKGKKPAESEQAQVAASREILDRGYGRPAQVLSADSDQGPIVITWGDASSV